MLLYIALLIVVALLSYRLLFDSGYVYRKFSSPSRPFPLIGHVHKVRPDRLHVSIRDLPLQIGKLNGASFRFQMFAKPFIVVSSFETIRQIVQGRHAKFDKRYDLRQSGQWKKITMGCETYESQVSCFGDEVVKYKGFAFGCNEFLVRFSMSLLGMPTSKERVEAVCAYHSLLDDKYTVLWQFCPTWLKVIWFPLYRQENHFKKQSRALLDRHDLSSDTILAINVLYNFLSTFVACMLHDLDLQRAIRQEIRSNVKQENTLTTDHKSVLPYTLSAVLETIRLSPPVPLVLATTVDSNCAVSGCPLPTGTRLLLDFCSFHSDSTIWTNASEFWPERFFDPETKSPLPPEHSLVTKLAASIDMQTSGVITCDDLIDLIFLFGGNLVKKFLLEPNHLEPAPAYNPLEKKSAITLLPPSFKVRMTKL